ncbi:hypothetical protein E0Z10_g2181 [Xylaria hypoxylon]|uniref:Uncharacterized protein n=1 Tax=Xylaria hypoxylon TaxID=37992 RepID=A0A4Z0ZD43_9PEZI|nr:hypothetical protein E0Z10_g2181 [Xylaria hypoxylon]
METSAPKRRKTSPTTSVPVDESRERASSDSATRSSSRLNRPSFASPTKASLARSNPEVLRRRASSRGSQPFEELPAPAASEPGSPTAHIDSENDLVTAQLEDESETGRLQRDAGGGHDNTTVERPKSPVRATGGEMSMKPRRTPNKPSPRPLPPPSAEEEELINPFKGRRLRRSPPPGVLPQIRPEEPEEPELPPTPTQKGLSDPSSIITSPIGIHNTPSKRPRRSRVLAARIMSSPLKQPPLRPPELDSGATIEETVSSRLAKEPLRDEPRRKRGKRKSHPAREIEEVDPLADKVALRDSLLAEIAQLEDDLVVASRENERLYSAQGSRRHITDLPDVEEQTRLLDILSRHALPPEKDAPPDPMLDWLETAMNPIAFLPFGRADAVSLLPSFLPPGSQKVEETEPPPISHHPVPMTADEELSYLQVFTPLTFSSTITTIQPEDQESLLQRHAISVASSPPGLFVATIDMTVDTKALAVAELAVPRLDPSAVAELGPFVERILKGAAGNTALTRNVAVVTWAMGEWVRLATRRARFWYAVQQELGNAEGLMRCAETMRRRKPRGRARYENEEETEDEDGEHESLKTRPKRADVVALMGRTSIDMDLSGVAGDDEDGSLVARIQWHVEFDWTGEARSKIALLLSAPAKWHASDGKGSLAGLSDMFDKLLREGREPLEAVKIVVALIVGDGAP